jgi:predicted enzyme related to lactoylglutathione lyase
MAVQIKGIDIHPYLVDDLERARKFYSETLGLSPVPGGYPYEFELPDGSTFGLYKPQAGDGIETWQKCYGIMFAVDDAHEAVNDLRSRGVTISGPTETPVCFMAFGEDSEGNQFIIHQRK